MTLEKEKDEKVVFPIKIESPHLWNGKRDPFMYQTETTLWSDGRLLDKVVQPLGIRFFRIDPDKGFFLNGEYLKLECADIRIDLNWGMLYVKNTMRRIHILCWKWG